MPNDLSGIEVNIATVAAHWIRFGQALASAIALEADDRTGAADASADIVRDALRFRTTTVLESVRGLRDTGGARLFRLLHEVPVVGAQDALSWDNLISMRNRMVHRWWTIDDSIVQATVRNDFPLLNRLAESVLLIPDSHADPSSARAAAAMPSPPASIIYLDHTAGLSRLNL